jgi:paired amphipathic helix protein Sin3a
VRYFYEGEQKLLLLLCSYDLSFIYRCVNEGCAFIKDERVKIRVSFPSYKLVYEAGCEDVIWGKTNYTGLEEQAEKREQERRRSRWLVSE